MFCRNCGKEVSDKAVACIGCGMNPKDGNAHCPACGVATKDKQIVCIACGSSLKGEGKQRHGCLTAWLVLMIISSAATVLMGLLGSATLRQIYPTAPGWAFPAFVLLGIANVVSAVALFQWKKWGFYAFLTTALVSFFVNLAMGLDIVQAIAALAGGFAIFYGVLHIGKESKGWTQLD